MNSISASEILKILAHQWAGTEDIKRIGSIGNNKALKIKREIVQRLKDTGDEYALPRNKVPMEEVMKYFKLNVEYLTKLAKKGNIDNE
jgi:hypothetical protein